MTKKEKLKELIALMPVTRSMLEITMRQTGCDGKYAEAEPLDYSIMVSLYKEALDNFLVEALGVSIQDEDMLDKIILMHKSEEFKAMDKASLYFSEIGDPLAIAKPVAADPRVPSSFVAYIGKRMVETVSNGIDSVKEKLDIQNVAPGIGRIDISSPEQFKEVLATLKAITGSDVKVPEGLQEAIADGSSGISPEDSLLRSISNIGRSMEDLTHAEDEDCECKDCTADDCANRDEPHKDTVLN